MNSLKNKTISLAKISFEDKVTAGGQSYCCGTKLLLWDKVSVVGKSHMLYAIGKCYCCVKKS